MTMLIDIEGMEGCEMLAAYCQRRIEAFGLDAERRLVDEAGHTAWTTAYGPQADAVADAVRCGAAQVFFVDEKGMLGINLHDGDMIKVPANWLPDDLHTLIVREIAERG